MKNTTANGTPLNSTVGEHISDTSIHINDLRAKLCETEQLLKETQLQLCELEFEKIEYNRKYLYFERQADYWEDQARQIQSRFDTVLNSKFWRLRSKLLAPFNRFRKTAPIPATDCASPAKELPAAIVLQNIHTVNSDWEQRLHTQPRIAVQVHAFYPDLIIDVCAQLSHMPYPYDLYVTTTEKYKQTYISDYLSKNTTAENWIVEIVENRGRDVIPFLRQLQPVISNYDYICHLHTKRSLLYDIGNQWRSYLYENLLGNAEHIQKILYQFESNPSVGIIFPEIPTYIRPYMDWGNNKSYAVNLMNAMHFDISLPDDIIFPAGTMFWARTAAVKELFTLDLSTLEIPKELGQTDGTIMHAIERLWVYVAEANNYTYSMTVDISVSDD